MILSTTQAQWLERRAKPCPCGGRITMHQRLADEGKTALPYGQADLRCSLCGKDTFDVERTWSELRKAGYVIPGIIEQRLAEKEESKMALVKRPEQEGEVRYALALRADSKPRDLTKFAGEISPVEVQKALALVSYGFDANLHLQLYQNRVIISKDGALWWLQGGPEEDTRFAGYETHPVPEGEKAAYGLAEDEIGCIAEGYRWRGNNRYKVADAFGKVSTRPYTYRAPRSATTEEWNRMTSAEKAALNREREEARANPDYNRNPIEATNPWAMAQKRALVQLATKMHPLGVQLLTEADVFAGDLGTEGSGKSDPTGEGFVPPSAPPTAAKEEPAHPQVTGDVREMAPDGSGALGPDEYVDANGEIRQGRLGEP